MNDQLAAIAKQRGKTIALLVVLGFIQSMVHPETAVAVWPVLSIAVGALGGMEAWASKGSE